MVCTQAMDRGSRDRSDHLGWMERSKRNKMGEFPSNYLLIKLHSPQKVLSWWKYLFSFSPLLTGPFFLCYNMHITCTRIWLEPSVSFDFWPFEPSVSFMTKMNLLPFLVKQEDRLFSKKVWIFTYYPGAEVNSVHRKESFAERSAVSSSLLTAALNVLMSSKKLRSFLVMISLLFFIIIIK